MAGALVLSDRLVEGIGHEQAYRLMCWDRRFVLEQDIVLLDRGVGKVSKRYGVSGLDQFVANARTAVVVE